jgi:hypothetical protein
VPVRFSPVDRKPVEETALSSQTNRIITSAAFHPRTLLYRVAVFLWRAYLETAGCDGCHIRFEKGRCSYMQILGVNCTLEAPPMPSYPSNVEFLVDYFVAGKLIFTHKEWRSIIPKPGDPIETVGGMSLRVLKVRRRPKLSRATVECQWVV